MSCHRKPPKKMPMTKRDVLLALMLHKFFGLIMAVEGSAFWGNEKKKHNLLFWHLDPQIYNTKRSISLVR